MKLIKITCPNCGANLNFNINNKNYKCEYCKTDILVDDEIVKIEHTVTNSEKKEKIKVGEAYLYDLEEYDKALSIYLELSETYPYVPEFWFNIIRSLTKNFNTTEDNVYDASILEKCNYYFEKYLKVEKDELTKKNNEQIYKTYINNIKKINNKRNSNDEEFNKEFFSTLVIVIFAIIIFLFLVSLMSY